MNTERKLNIFISYAHEDAKFIEKLERCLEQENIIVWYDHENSGGTNRAKNIKDHINKAHIILLLVSSDFMASEHCYNIELKQALRRHEADHVSIIPILLRPVDFEDTLLSDLHILPENGRAITSWPNRDEAFADVVKDVQKNIKELFTVENAHNKSTQGLSIESEQVLSREDSFSSNRVEDYTNLGRILRQAERYEEALKEYEKALSLASNELSLYKHKGTILQLLERYEEALATYEQALSLAPNDPILLSNKGSILQRLGRHEMALAIYEQVLKLDSDTFTLLEEDQEQALLKIEQYEEALTTFDPALHVAPEKHRFYADRGERLERIARMQYQKYIQLAQQSYGKAKQLKDEQQR